MGHGKFNLVFNTLTLPLCGLENLLEVPKLLLIEEGKKPQGNPGRWFLIFKEEKLIEKGKTF